jgi:hypothetical protein
MAMRDTAASGKIWRAMNLLEITLRGAAASRKSLRNLRFACLLLAALACLFPAAAEAASDSPGGVRVTGPGVQPHLGFACCDKGIRAMQDLFADPSVVADLGGLHAQVAIQIADFSPERAAIVQKLNQAGIGVVAWLVLAPQDGFYLNADNAGAAAARVSAFEQWTQQNHLHWDAVGLDIEPDFSQLNALKDHRRRLFAMLLRRSWDIRRMNEAVQAYSMLVRDLQMQGFRVQTYQMPYLPVERSVGTTLIDRMLGTVDIQGNGEYLMMYSSFNRRVGAAMIWTLGRGAQGISVGVTDGPGTPGTGMGPLNWDEFSRDLIVASHFTPQIGVYDLEGCVRQGFLPRLRTMNWNESVVVPSQSIASANRLGLLIRSVLWLASYSLWFVAGDLVLVVALMVWRRNRKRKVARV